MQGLRIAIVDDEPEISRLIKMRLSKDAPDYEIIAFDSAEACLKHIEENPVDCILTDYQMPGTDGMEMLGALRNRGDDTPVIFITGQGSEEVAREAFKNGAHDYFTKEMGFAKFPRILNSITQAVKRRRAELSRERAETDLVAERNKLQSILTNIGDGISIQDLDLRVLYQNPAHIGFIGDHKGEFCYEAYEKSDRACESCPVVASFRDGRTHIIEKTLGTYPEQRHFEIKASPLLGADGEIVAGIEAVREITDRRKAEAAHIESERFLSNIFTSIRDGIVIIDMDYNVLRVNPVIEKWYAHAMPLVGRKCYEVFLGRGDVCEVCPSMETMRTRNPSTETVVKRGRDGEITGWIELSTFPFIDEASGQMKGVIEYARDITMPDDEPLKSRKTLESVVEAIKFGMVIVGADRRIRYANRTALSMMGANNEQEIVGSICHQKICPAEAGKCPIMDLGQKVDLSEKFLLTKDGGRIPILKTVTPITISGEELLLETFVDITAQKDAQREVARSRTFLQSVVDGTADPIMVIDPDYRVSLMNDAARRLSQYPEGAAEGITCYQLSHGSDSPCSSVEGHECPLDGVRNTGKPTTVVHRHKGAGGHDVWVEITASPMLDEKGDIISVIESSRDITDRKDMEQQRQEFYAMVTHDLKGSLTTILGYSELLSTDMDIDAGARDMVSGIRKSAKRLASMVDSYLAYTRLEDGGARLNKRPADASELISDAEAEFAEFAAQKGMYFRTEVQDGLPRLMLDGVYVQRALCNLLENALNYTPPGGEITVGAARRETEGGAEVVIYVSDTGPGIPEAEREKIFNKYYRSSRTSGVKGSGLGLAVVKAVMDAHGGRVELESTVGEGSTFSLVFPAADRTP